MGMIGIGDATTGPQATTDVVSAMTDDQAYAYMAGMTEGDIAAMNPAALDLLSAKAQASPSYLAAAGYKQTTGTPTTTVPTQTKWLLAIAAGFVLIVMMRR